MSNISIIYWRAAMSAATHPRYRGGGIMQSPPKYPDRGPAQVDTRVVIVLTRFRVKTMFHLIATWADSLRLQRRSKNTPGLLMSTFVIESPTSALSISFWESDRAISESGTNQVFHVSVGNAVFPRLAHGNDGKPELWSIRAQPTQLSHNLRWGTFDLRGHCIPLATEKGGNV